jgi:hypothetical protein
MLAPLSPRGVDAEGGRGVCIGWMDAEGGRGVCIGWMNAEGGRGVCIGWMNAEGGRGVCIEWMNAEGGRGVCIDWMNAEGGRGVRSRTACFLHGYFFLQRITPPTYLENAGSHFSNSALFYVSNTNRL